MTTATPTQVIIAEVTDTDDSKVRWFSYHGCVVHNEEQAEVFVGGLLIGAFGRRDVGLRNLLLIGLAKDRRVPKGKLAQAFGLGAERLRRICRQVEADGIEAIPRRPRGGRRPLATPRVRRRMEELFAAGLSGPAAFEQYGKRAGLKLRAALRLREQWGAKGESVPQPRNALRQASRQAMLRNTTQ